MRLWAGLWVGLSEAVGRFMGRPQWGCEQGYGQAPVVRPEPFEGAQGSLGL